MSCCCPEANSASRLFSFFARSYRKRYAKKGFEKSQKQLVEGLRQAGLEGGTLLEIGSGVGYLHQTLLEQGAVSAVGVDLSPKMIAEAVAAAKEKGLSDRAEYVQDDFVNIAETLNTADVTILDKVVCCYPDADALVHKSLEHTSRVYALTYPRDRWFVRLGSKIGAVIFWTLRMDFRNYIHSPARLEQWIEDAGFRKEYENQTIGWQTQVFVRP
jgi:2-polyprenyl-3-methyl-5-hydroxy-6-metoxy-1,4-benzoquinol methylase